MACFFIVGVVVGVFIVKVAHYSAFVIGVVDQFVNDTCPLIESCRARRGASNGG
ncbi:hypothetical protein C2G38_2237714 [Gigaspora rosea]|uniref:Uncharacterized protein n=1 Tax=Gigaspora rosea TaxID=44941 RepID=A0A397TPF8_9GLOM|nr:hypothetical protein C2G38_2237714 [Gigaspora rosea]